MSRSFLRFERAMMRAYRQDAWRKQGKRCKYCLAPLSGDSITADHITPRTMGGRNVASNIAAACLPCNMLKNRMPPKRFVAILDGRVPAPDFDYKVQGVIRRIHKRADEACKRIEAFAR